MAKNVTRFHGPAQVSNAAATKYTVPAATMAVIQHIHLSNPSGSAVTFTMSIGTDAAAVRVYDAYSIAANAVLDVYPIYVMSAGEVLQALAGTTNILTLTVDGYTITLG